MCGIFLSLAPPKTSMYARLLLHRGPDWYIEFNKDECVAISSVLAIRECTFQPIIKEEYMLQYNGEIYNGQTSDTLFIVEELDRIVKKYALDSKIYDNGSKEQEVLQRDKVFIHYGRKEGINKEAVDQLFDFVESLYLSVNAYENEMAITIYSKGKVFFFKDDVGKRSIGLIKEPFTICSLLYEEEIDPLRLYIYDIATQTLLSRFKPGNEYTKWIFNSAATISAIKNRDKYAGMYEYLVGYEALDGSTGVLPDSGMLNEIFAIQKFKEFFQEAIKLRLHGNKHVVFFSGGVDSSLIALFIHLCAPIEDEIHLINTSFPCGPDRISGCRSYQELQARFPERTFVFVKNDVTDEDLKDSRECVLDLIHPKTTVMHEYIGEAHYLTAKKAKKDKHVVVFTGSGADEAFCGYRKYKLPSGGVDRDMMLFDLATISAHNVSRDERIISDASLEVRLPFLDTRLLRLSFSLPDSLLVNNGSNKFLLRVILREYNLDKIASEPKRAIHFGTNISHALEKARRQ